MLNKYNIAYNVYNKIKPDKKVTFKLRESDTSLHFLLKAGAVL